MKDLTPGIYILRNRVKNPKADLRTRHNWTLAEYFEPGEYQVRTVTIAGTRYTYLAICKPGRIYPAISESPHIDPNNRWGALAPKLEPLPTTPKRYLQERESTMVTYAVDLLDILYYQGKVDLKDVKEAAEILEEHWAREEAELTMKERAER